MFVCFQERLLNNTVNHKAMKIALFFQSITVGRDRCCCFCYCGVASRKKKKQLKRTERWRKINKDGSLRGNKHHKYNLIRKIDYVSQS